MARFKAAKSVFTSFKKTKLGRKTVRKARKAKKLVLPAAFVAGGGVGAAAASYLLTQPGHRKAAAKEGAVIGAVATTAVAAAPRVGKFVFRRIKGRIIPIFTGKKSRRRRK